MSIYWKVEWLKSSRATRRATHSRGQPLGLSASYTVFHQHAATAGNLSGCWKAAADTHQFLWVSVRNFNEYFMNRHGHIITGDSYSEDTSKQQQATSPFLVKTFPEPGTVASRWSFFPREQWQIDVGCGLFLRDHLHVVDSRQMLFILHSFLAALCQRL